MLNPSARQVWKPIRSHVRGLDRHMLQSTFWLLCTRLHSSKQMITSFNGNNKTNHLNIWPFTNKISFGVVLLWQKHEEPMCVLSNPLQPCHGRDRSMNYRQWQQTNDVSQGYRCLNNHWSGCLRRQTQVHKVALKTVGDAAMLIMIFYFLSPGKWRFCVRKRWRCQHSAWLLHDKHQPGATCGKP